MTGKFIGAILVVAASALGFVALQSLATSGGSVPSAGDSFAAATPPASIADGSVPDGPQPRAVVDEPVFDFGTMRIGEQRSHVFVIRNAGDAPLVLGEPDATCKCTVGKLAHNEVPPGGSVEVTLEWKGTKLDDGFHEGADIPTNDPQRNSLRLAVVGRIEPVLVIRPTFHWNAGDLTGDGPQTVTGTIHSTLLDSFALETIELNDPLFTARAAPLDDALRKKLAATAGYVIEVTIDPNVPDGPAEAMLTIDTDIADLDPVQVRVTGHRHGPIRFLPAPGVRWDGVGRAIDLGRFAAAEGRSAVLHLFVTEAAGEPFRVTQVEADPRYLDVDLAEDRGFHAPGRRRFALTISVPAGSPPAVRLQDGCATVRLHTNHARAEVVEVYVEFRSF